VTNEQFERQLKEYDPGLFLGYGKHGYLTVYYRRGERLKPKVVMNLYIEPYSHTIDYIKKMDTWHWEKDWTKKIDDYNNEIEMKKAMDERERMENETADTIRYWRKHFDGEEGTQSYIHTVSKKLKDVTNG